MKQRGEIGRYLDQLLLDRGWHQTDLAEQSGISVAFISEIMRGGKNIAPETIEKIVVALEKSKRLQRPIRNRLHFEAATKAGYLIEERVP